MVIPMPQCQEKTISCTYVLKSLQLLTISTEKPRRIFDYKKVQQCIFSPQFSSKLQGILLIPFACGLAGLGQGN